MILICRDTMASERSPSSRGKSRKRRDTMNRYPPGPRDWLFGANLVSQIRRDTMGFYARMAREYGDCVHMRLLHYHSFVFFHPEQVKEVLVTKAKQFRRFRRPLDVLAQWNGRHSVIIVEGDEWLRQRRLAQPAFHPRRFGEYGKMIVDLTKAWTECRLTAQGKSFDIVQEMTDLALAINARVLFGINVVAEAPQFSKAMNVLAHVAFREFMQIRSLPDWLPLPGKAEKRWAIRYVDETIRGVIRKWRAEAKDHGDLLSMILMAVDEEGDGRSVTDDEARDSLVTMFVAGHDTVSAALSWVWYVLTSHPEVEAQVLNELDSVLGDRSPTADDLPQLAHLDRVIKETMRLYPPAPGVFTRQSIADVEIGGYQLPVGSLVTLFSAVTQCDPRWFADPEKFDPDHFAPEQAESRPQFAYFPFGAGPRQCIGNSLAMMTMTLLVATVMQRMRLSMAPEQGPVESHLIMSLRPKGEVRMVAKAREPALAGANA
jgi:cytochrome P450